VTNAKTLRRQLLQWMLLLLLGPLVLGMVHAYNAAQNFSGIAYDQALSDTTLALAAQTRIQSGAVVVDLPRVASNILRYTTDGTIYFQVKDTNGVVIAGDNEMPMPTDKTRIVGKLIFYDGTMHGKSVRVAAVYHQIADSPSIALVQVAETLTKRTQMAEEMLTGVVLPQLALTLLAIVSVWYGVGRGLAPLQKVQQQIADRSHRDLTPVLEQDIPEEVRPLVHSINALMERLGISLAAQRRFVADAAHQLRTPLAGLKTQAEFALRQTDPATIQHALQQLAASAERATHLANQLLALARAEPDASQLPTLTPIDLNNLARNVTTTWVPEALKKDIDLGYHGPMTPVMVYGDPLLLTEMMTNLIDNAIRYTQQGGEVTVHLSETPAPLLVVEDNGPGIPVEERQRVFKRFYRVLGSGAEGSGLGLSIVREIALTHNCHIELEEPQAQRGTRVCITFPA
jgi:two-component system sensor histidine kinase TctE